MPRARGLWRARLDHAVCGSSIGGALTAAILCGFMAFAMIDGLCYHVVPLLHLAILLPLFWSSGPDPETSDETP